MHVDASSSSLKFLKHGPPYGRRGANLKICALYLFNMVIKTTSLLLNPRNMMLQDESIDDDIEHFEDVIEESDNEPSPVSEEKDIELVHNSDTANSDHDSSEDDIDSPASYSEDEGSDEADEFLFRNDSKESKMVPDSSVQQPQVVSSEKSALPGGYDPRHREPSYWLVFFFQAALCCINARTRYVWPLYFSRWNPGN